MLVVDTRQWRTAPGARNFLERTLGDDICAEQLVSGDYAATNTPLSLGIEHKDFNDLAGSLMSNRLDIQCAALVSSYDVPVLLISDWPAAKGPHYPLFGTKGRTIAVKWVNKTLHSWSLRGLIVDKYRTGSEVGPAVLAWYETCKVEEHRTTYEPKRLLENLRPLSLIEQVMLTLPGVGPTRAAAFRGFSPVNLPPDVQGWQDKLGKVTGQRAYEAWHNGK